LKYFKQSVRVILNPNIFLREKVYSREMKGIV